MLAAFAAQTVSEGRRRKPAVRLNRAPRRPSRRTATTPIAGIVVASLRAKAACRTGAPVAFYRSTAKLGLLRLRPGRLAIRRRSAGPHFRRQLGADTSTLPPLASHRARPSPFAPAAGHARENKLLPRPTLLLHYES